jgi:hypothetical protein
MGKIFKIYLIQIKINSYIMKKAIIAITAVMFLISCGGSTETTTNDSLVTPGVDSSVVLPPLTDSAKADSVGVGGKADFKPVE